VTRGRGLQCRAIPGAIFSSRNHGPWAARIELRISARFIFLNPTISLIQGPVKLKMLAAWSLKLDWPIHELASLVNAWSLRPGPGARSWTPYALPIMLMT